MGEPFLLGITHLCLVSVLQWRVFGSFEGDFPLASAEHHGVMVFHVYHQTITHIMFPYPTSISQPGPSQLPLSWILQPKNIPVP